MHFYRFLFLTLTPFVALKLNTRHLPTPTPLAIKPSRIVEASIIEPATPNLAATLKLKIRIPHPGHQLQVEEIAKPDSLSRIAVTLRDELRPGFFAQVISEAEVLLPIKIETPGHYAIDLYVRSDAQRGQSKAPEPIGTVLINAP